VEFQNNTIKIIW